MSKKARFFWIVNNILIGMLLALEIFFKSSRCKVVGYLILIFSIWLVEGRIIKKKLKGDFEFFEEVARIVRSI